MFMKNDTIMFVRRRNTCKNLQEFPVIHDKRLKAFKKRNAIKNVWEETKENPDFVENNNFTRGIIETVVREYSGVNLQENTLGRVHRTLSQLISCKISKNFLIHFYRTPLDGWF